MEAQSLNLLHKHGDLSLNHTRVVCSPGTEVIETNAFPGLTGNPAFLSQ